MGSDSAEPVERPEHAREPLSVVGEYPQRRWDAVDGPDERAFLPAHGRGQPVDAAHRRHDGALLFVETGDEDVEVVEEGMRRSGATVERDAELMGDVVQLTDP